jgi:hypothetical protein
MKFRIIALSIALCFFATLVKAQTQESKIQAIFLLKFIENVSWPKEKKGLVIGVVGSSEVTAEIEGRLKMKNPDGIVVKKITAAESASCDVVFLPTSKDNQFSSVTESVANKSILLVTESDFAKKGAGISFIKEGGKLQFQINKNDVESRGLKIGGILLSLGTQV